VSLAEYLVLALVSALWPTLVAVVIFALTRERPQRLLLGFLAGGLLTTITVGLLIVFLLSDTALVNQSRSKTDPVVDFTVGVLCLIVAWAARRSDRRRPLRTKPEKPKRQKREGPSRTERALERGPMFAFLFAILINLMPGFFYLVALKDIAEANYGTAPNVVLVVVFCLLMFTLIEVPILSYAVAPEKTAVWANGFNAWLRANARHLIPVLALLVGILLIARGIASLL
jgi:Sap-like sulfolipid-1-addressing protein